MVQGSEQLGQYKRKGTLTRRKLAEYIPVMIITNISLLLIMSVDGLIAGNFISKDALSSISIFYPISVLTGVFSAVTGSGIATSLSTAIGRNDLEELSRIKRAAIRIMIFMAILVGIAQIPIVTLVIRSYELSPQMNDLVWRYAIGNMLCAPLSLISTVGTYELQISGKMKVLMGLTIIEGVCNTIFDLFFVAVLHMSVEGTGYGTAVANLVRCSLTVLYIWKYTDFYNGEKIRFQFSGIYRILRSGIPDAAFPVVSALQNYCLLKILLQYFGSDGGVINGVCAFCLTIANVLINGIQSGMRPLMGLFVGAKDNDSVTQLMRQGILINVVLLGTVTAVVELVPRFFYEVHGVDQIPDGGLLSLRFFAIFFTIRGLTFLFRLFFTNQKDIRFATFLTLCGNAVLPVFAFLIVSVLSAPYVFISYTVTEVLVLLISLYRYWWLRRKKEPANPDVIELYMTVMPKDAVEASRRIRRFADENGIAQRISYRVSLCMEEMVAYVEQSKRLLFQSDEEAGVEVLIRFLGKDHAVFVTLDEGRCISLDLNEDSQKLHELTTDNYGLIKKIAHHVDYQYILNMNYTRISF